MLTAPGPHPDAATLRQYAAGTLSPAEEQRVEAHAIDCERCSELLDGFTMTDAPTTDQALAGLRARLQARVGEPVPAVPATRPLWPRVAAAAAATLILAGGLWSWERQPQAPEVATILTEAPTPAAPETPAPAAPAPEAPAPESEAPAPAPHAGPAAEPGPSATPPAVPPARPRALRRLQPARPTIAGTSKPAPVPAAEARTEAPAPAGVATQGTAAPTELALHETPPATEKDAPKEESKELSEVAVPATDAAAKAPPKAKASAAEASSHRAAPMPAGPTVAPAPMGGTLALREYLRRSASQFDPVINAGRLTGSVHVRFTVGEDGKVSNVKVTRRLRPDYDAEAQRIVCDGPAWQPGISGGRRAALPVDVVVPF